MVFGMFGSLGYASECIGFDGMLERGVLVGIVMWIIGMFFSV